MDDLTTRQRRILDFIGTTVRERGYPPTVRAIGLATDGEHPVQGVAIPLVGRIAAGAPLLAEENVEEYLTVPVGFADGVDHFALRVEGESMTGAGILDRDVVVIRRQDDADDGDIVAALLPGPAEEEATVKRLHRQGSAIE